MILKKQYKDFINWVLRRHGRRMVNALADEQIMQMRIREWMLDVNGVELPPDAFTRNLEEKDGTGSTDVSGESSGEACRDGD